MDQSKNGSNGLGWRRSTVEKTNLVHQICNKMWHAKKGVEESKFILLYGGEIFSSFCVLTENKPEIWIFKVKGCPWSKLDSKYG